MAYEQMPRPREQHGRGADARSSSPAAATVGGVGSVKFPATCAAVQAAQSWIARQQGVVGVAKPVETQQGVVGVAEPAGAR
eukprot:scaffold313909_cov14-Tisochrysis_lutea.AAC.1